MTTRKERPITTYSEFESETQSRFIPVDKARNQPIENTVGVMLVLLIGTFIS